MNSIPKLSIPALLCLILFACDKDNPEPVIPVNVSFPSDFESIIENSTPPLIVQMEFPAQPTSDGSFKIALAGQAIYGTDYTTNPDGSSGAINANVVANAGIFEFSIQPIDNIIIDGDREINLSITDATGGIQAGSVSSMVVRILNNDFPVQVDFLLSEITEPKTTSEVTIAINFWEGAMAAGSFEVAITSDNAVYGTDYTTIPDGSSGTISYGVDFTESSKSLNVYPVAGQSFSPPKVIVFTLQNAMDGIVLGTVQQTHTFTITE